jgi:hypothetical protein
MINPQIIIAVINKVTGIHVLTYAHDGKYLCRCYHQLKFLTAFGYDMTNVYVRVCLELPVSERLCFQLVLFNDNKMSALGVSGSDKRCHY